MYFGLQVIPIQVLWVLSPKYLLFGYRDALGKGGAYTKALGLIWELYICMCICIHIYIYIYTHIHMHICIYNYLVIYIYIYISCTYTRMLWKLLSKGGACLPCKVTGLSNLGGQ